MKRGWGTDRRSGYYGEQRFDRTTSNGRRDRVAAEGVSVYVGRLPAETGWGWVKSVFVEFGKIERIFVSRYVDRVGCKYAFVSFLRSTDAQAAIRANDGMRVAGRNIVVSIARERTGRGGLIQSMGFRGRQERTEVQRVWREKKRPTENVAPNKLSRETVSVGGSRSCTLSLSAENKRILDNCYIGEANGYYEVGWLLKCFADRGETGIWATRISASFFVIGFRDSVTKDRLCAEEWIWFQDWFISIKPWNSDFAPADRFAKIIVYGLPLAVWSKENIVSIGSLWGEVVSSEGVEELPNDSRICCVYVLTTIVPMINETISCKFGDAEANIRVSEVVGTGQWEGIKPSSFYSMCTEPSSKVKEVNPNAEQERSHSRTLSAEYEKVIAIAGKSGVVGANRVLGGSEKAHDEKGKEVQVADDEATESVCEKVWEYGGCSKRVINEQVVGRDSSELEYVEETSESVLDLWRQEFEAANVDELFSDRVVELNGKTDANECDDHAISVNGVSETLMMLSPGLGPGVRSSTLSSRALKSLKKKKSYRDNEKSRKKSSDSKCHKSEKTAGCSKKVASSCSPEIEADSVVLDRINKKARATWEIAKSVGFVAGDEEEEVIRRIAEKHKDLLPLKI